MVKLRDIFITLHCEFEKIISEHEWDFILKENPNTPLGYVNEELKTLGKKALLELIAVICIIGFVICMVFFLKLKFSYKRMENKRWIGYLLIGGIIVFGVGGILALIASIVV